MTLMNRRTALAGLGMGAGLAATGGQRAFAQAPIAWDMPTPYSDGTFQTQIVRSWVEDVEKRVPGKIKITVHSNASLIKMPEMRRAVQSGQVPTGEILISVLGNENAIFAFDSVPGLVSDFQSAGRLWKAAKPKVEAALDKSGLMLLQSIAWPPQCIYAKKPLEALADLKGAKFRSFNPATARFAQLIGATPATVQVPEIAQAFRTGLLDAMITSGATGVDTQAWDYLTHFYEVNAFLPQNAVLVNKAAFAALPKDVQDAMKAAAADAEVRGWKRSEELTEQYKKTMADKGMKILPATAKMKEEMAAIGKTMADEWAQKAGPDGQAILAAFRQAS
jgi:TRAP-type C4-dicarboxylate transport system substrate-binding protein